MAVIKLGGDEAALVKKWDLGQTGHHRLPDNLGDGVTEDTPLRLLWQKTLSSSDARSQQIRLVIHKNVAEGIFFPFLSHEQRNDLCNDQATIPVVGFDEQGRKWKLHWRMRVQTSNSSSRRYVLQGEWGRMLKRNGWRKGTVISIWGFHYGGIRDKCEFGPDQLGFHEIFLVFT